MQYQEQDDDIQSRYRLGCGGYFGSEVEVLTALDRHGHGWIVINSEQVLNVTLTKRLWEEMDGHLQDGRRWMITYKDGTRIQT